MIESGSFCLQQDEMTRPAGGFFDVCVESERVRRCFTLYLGS
jgi:hypothetical protein